MCDVGPTEPIKREEEVTLFRSLKEKKAITDVLIERFFL